MDDALPTEAEAIEELLLCASEGSLDALHALRDIDTSLLLQKGPSKWTLLHMCCWRGYLSLVESLLAIDGIDINAQTSAGFTPLILACQKGHEDVVALLLQHPAKVNLLTNEGRNALSYACAEGHAGVVSILLSHTGEQVGVNNSSSMGWTPLHWACWKGGLAVVDALLSLAGEKLDVGALTAIVEEHPLPSGYGAVLLYHLAGLPPIGLAAHAGKDAIVAALLGRCRVEDLCLNALNRTGMSTVAVAAAKYRCKVVHLLLELPPEHVDLHAGNVPCLSAAIQRKVSPVIEELLQLPAERFDLNYRTTALQKTPLMEACGQAMDSKTVALLLDQAHRIDLDARDIGGRTAMHYAATADRNPRQLGIAVRKLLQHGADPNARDKAGRTPVMLSFTRCPTILRRAANPFLELRPELIALNAADNEGMTALMYASRPSRFGHSKMDECRLEALRQLLEKGSLYDLDVAATNNKGQTAVDIAKEAGWREAVELLPVPMSKAKSAVA